MNEDIPIQDLKTAPSLYSYRYLGQIEIKLRFQFSIKYYDGYIDKGHERFIKTLENNLIFQRIMCLV